MNQVEYQVVISNEYVEYGCPDLVGAKRPMRWSEQRVQKETLRTPE
jgi:hypothetical protein